MREVLGYVLFTFGVVLLTVVWTRIILRRKSRRSTRVDVSDATPVVPPITEEEQTEAWRDYIPPERE